MKKIFRLFLAWVHSYFKHPLPDIRRVESIKPGQLYDIYGYVCHTTAYSDEERRQLVSRFTIEGTSDSLPMKCKFCAFYQIGIPCPPQNFLHDGTAVCDTNKYIIIKKPQ